MQTTQKTSSSFKVGILTVTAIIILIFTVMWIKGRSLSAGDRLEVKFLDVNGMRAGSGVQILEKKAKKNFALFKKELINY